MKKFILAAWMVWGAVIVSNAQQVTKEYPAQVSSTLSNPSITIPVLTDIVGLDEVVVNVQGTWTGTMTWDCATAADLATFATKQTITANGNYTFSIASCRIVRVATDAGWTGLASYQIRVTKTSLSGATSYTNVRLTDGTNFASLPGANPEATQDAAAINTGPQIMARASNALAALTSVSDGDAVRPAADLSGRLIHLIGCPVEDVLQGLDVDTAGTSTSVIAAQGANIRIAIYSVFITNNNLLGTAANVALQDGVGGATRANIAAPANLGQVLGLSVPIVFPANTAVAVQPSAALSTVTTTVVGCKVRG